MSAILLILGIVVTGAGLAALGFGIPINEFSLGTPLIVAGTTALCGGLILIGLSAAVAELRRIGDLLKLRPMVQPARRAEAAAAPPAVPAPAPTASMPPAPPVQPPPYTGPPPPTPVTLGPATLGPATLGPATHGPAMSSPQAPGPSIPPPAPVNVRPPPPPARSRPEAPGRDLRYAEPQASPSASMDVSAAAFERLRSSIRPERPASMPEGDEVPLSPNGNHQPAQARRAGVEPALEPRLTPEDRLGGVAADTAKASRLDFLFRSRQQALPRADSLDPNWPAEARPARSAPPDVAVQSRYSDVVRSGTPAASSSQAPAPGGAPVESPQEPAAPPAAVEPPSAVLKSGVVDGMAYTLYTDGSIEAKLPDGTVKFGSIGELRQHIEKNP